MNNIKYIKDNADIKAILKYLNVDIINNGDSYRAACPIHGGKNKSAFDINSITGMWFCHTKCKCGGDIIELVHRVTNSTFYAACELIAKISGFKLNGIEFTKEEITQYEEAKIYFSAFKEPFKFSEYNLSVQETYPVTSFRGLSKEILKEYGVFFSRTFILSHSITLARVGFPIIFKGKLIGVDLRATKIGDNIKWLRQPKGLSCGHALYNYDKVIESDKNYVIIVEGIIDCLKLVQMGFPALCTFGSSITKPQKQLLENLGIDIYIAYDGDEAGLKGTNQVYRELHKTCDIYNIIIPDGLDPGNIEEELFNTLFNSSKIMRSEINEKI